ncbi:polymorphic toxin type 30 domain-containing protein [Proteus mirabilis]
MDINGNYHPIGIFNTDSPNYNPSLINDVHIPINKPTKFPKVL